MAAVKKPGSQCDLPADDDGISSIPFPAIATDRYKTLDTAFTSTLAVAAEKPSQLRAFTADTMLENVVVKDLLGKNAR